MLGARALRGFSILILLFFSTIAFASEHHKRPCHKWTCIIEKKIQKLQQTINKLAAILFQQGPDSFTPVPTSTPEEDEATTAWYSKTFGSPYTYTTDYFANPIETELLPQPTEVMGGGEGYRSVAYFVNWGIYGRKYPPQKIPADKLTHILYAFGDNRDDGEVILTDKWSDTDIHYEGDSWNDIGNNLYGNLKQLNLLKRENRNMKVLLSIGGWTYTNTQKHFDGPASTPQGRKRFANSCVELIKDLGFDGIDIDWEYPQNPEQGQQLLALLQEIRSAMDAYADQLATYSQYGHENKPHFVLSIAAPAGKQNYQNLPLSDIGSVLDFINLMCYDYSGSWDANAGHQANLYPSSSCPACTPFNTQSVIDAYTAAGVPSNKLVLGMPLYGRSFMNTTGIGQSYSGVGEGSWEAGVWDYKALPRPGATEYIDEEAGASYSYDSNTGMLVSYDTLEMANRKTQYIKQRNLGGAMWWELSGDRQDEESIVSNVVRELGGYDGGKLELQPNWLYYPDSQYENLKNGFPL